MIREAVLEACQVPKTHPDVKAAASLDRDAIKPACERLVTGNLSEAHPMSQNLGYWAIPPAQVALAHWVKDIVEKRKSDHARLPPLCIITPNFDELFEVALRRLGMRDQFQSFNLVGNQYPGSAGEPIQIWHVHGTWRDHRWSA